MGTKRDRALSREGRPTEPILYVSGYSKYCSNMNERNTRMCVHEVVQQQHFTKSPTPRAQSADTWLTCTCAAGGRCCCIVINLVNVNKCLIYWGRGTASALHRQRAASRGRSLSLTRERGERCLLHKQSL